MRTASCVPMWIGRQDQAMGEPATTAVEVRRVLTSGKTQRICRKALMTERGGTLEQLEARSGAGLGTVDSVL